MDFGIGPRMRAARQLGGFRNVADLAQAIEGRRGLGTTVLRQIEREERVTDYKELHEIAAVCGLPVEFFTADLSRLAEVSEDPRKVIARETAAAVLRAQARRAERSVGTPPLHEAGH